MELLRRAAGVATSRQGALEARRKCSDMEVFEEWMYGTLETRRRRSGVEAWRFGGLEARYRCSDVEVWRLAVSCSDVEVRSAGGVLQRV